MRQKARNACKSCIKGIIEIPLNGILFVPDYKSTFTDEVVSVEIEDGNLHAEQKKVQITNDIWDGESLLDESLFIGEYADKHMPLLCNKFFKSCAFRTKLQKWFKDKDITLADLKSVGDNCRCLVLRSKLIEHQIFNIAPVLIYSSKISQ